jgi:hypothetical protein
MKSIGTSFAACCLLIALSSPAFCLDVSGNWDMKSASRFTVSMKQSGELAKGSYGFGKGNRGEIVGLIYDGVMEGFWFQDTAGKKCKTPKNGTYYWGRIVLEFTDSDVQGKDGYCEEAPSSPWTGKKRP